MTDRLLISGARVVVRSFLLQRYANPILPEHPRKLIGRLGCSVPLVAGNRSEDQAYLHHIVLQSHPTRLRQIFLSPLPWLLQETAHIAIHADRLGQTAAPRNPQYFYLISLSWMSSRQLPRTRLDGSIANLHSSYKVQTGWYQKWRFEAEIIAPSDSRHILARFAGARMRGKLCDLLPSFFCSVHYAWGLSYISCVVLSLELHELIIKSYG